MSACGASLFDHLGRRFTLLRLDLSLSVASFEEAASEQGAADDPRYPLWEARDIFTAARSYWSDLTNTSFGVETASDDPVAVLAR
jgi:hypothetical protein